MKTKIDHMNSKLKSFVNKQVQDEGLGDGLDNIDNNSSVRSEKEIGNSRYITNTSKIGLRDSQEDGGIVY